jgi:HPt (histidine-containing phosphotransfer) domain-containing protein
MNDYISKPVRANDLLRALSDVARAKGRMVLTEATPEAPAPGPARVAAAPRGDPDALDEAKVNRLFADDAELAAELTASYRRLVAMRVADMRYACRTHDASTLHQAARAVKMGSRRMGAPLLAQLCEKIETLGHARSVDGAENLLESVEAAFVHVDERLAAIGPTRAA